jgi:hypothetical protein
MRTKERLLIIQGTRKKEKENEFQLVEKRK